MARLQHLDLEGTLANVNKLLVTTNARIDSIDTALLSQKTAKVLDKIDNKLDQLPMDKIGKEGAALLAELRTTNQRLSAVLDDPAIKRLPADADAAIVQLKKVLDDPNLGRSLAHLQNTLARLDRLTGGGEPPNAIPRN
jgi:hypothetical protein